MLSQLSIGMMYVSYNGHECSYEIYHNNLSKYGVNVKTSIPNLGPMYIVSEELYATISFFIYLYFDRMIIWDMTSY